jgi:pantoate--beta-alanine ligase
MTLFRTVAELRSYIDQARKDGKKTGFVPTMGALHAGHLSLISQSQAENDITVLSIFVNPTQFNESTDFSNYPRTEVQDLKLIDGLNVQAVFLPTTQEMYGAGNKNLLAFSLNGLDTVMEGRYRAGHFDGVITIVDKFLTIIQPDAAYFGLKDYQQLAIVRYLAEKRHPSVRIVACPIIREGDGLAMSSRNALLTAEERVKAVLISKVLFGIRDTWKNRSFEDIVNEARAAFLHSDFELEYLEISDAYTLQPLSDYSNKAAVVCVAARIGKVRLIDNCELPA